MSDQVEAKTKELKISARLVFEGKEVALFTKTFNVSEAEERTEEKEDASTTKTIDDTLTEFLNEVQDVANQNSYVVSKKTFINAATSLLLFIIRGTDQEITIDIELEKLAEENKNGDCKKNDS